MNHNKLIPSCFSIFKFLSRKVNTSTVQRHGSYKSPTLTCNQKHAMRPCDVDIHKSIETLPSYSSAVSDEPIFRPDVLKTIDAKIDELDSELRNLSLQIHGDFNSHLPLRVMK